MHRLLHRREGGQKHLDAGAKRVLISAPAKGAT
jgi:glyceraldehyde-3-phosphate dehydrogenase/erythrose-4-phosphate dehydrogenase